MMNDDEVQKALDAYKMARDAHQRAGVEFNEARFSKDRGMAGTKGRKAAKRLDAAFEAFTETNHAWGAASEALKAARLAAEAAEIA